MLVLVGLMIKQEMLIPPKAYASWTINETTCCGSSIVKPNTEGMNGMKNYIKATTQKDG